MKCQYSACLEIHPDSNYILPHGISNWVCSEECLYLMTEEKNKKENKYE